MLCVQSANMHEAENYLRTTTIDLYIQYSLNQQIVSTISMLQLKTIDTYVEIFRIIIGVEQNASHRYWHILKIRDIQAPVLW